VSWLWQPLGTGAAGPTEVTVAHTADAVLVTGVTEHTITHTADAVVQQQGRTVTHTADAVIPAGAQTLNNHFDGTDATVLTAGSGGNTVAGGDYFDTVNGSGAGDTIEFDTARYHSSPSSALLVSTTTGNEYVEWTTQLSDTTDTVYVRAYIYVATGVASSADKFIRLFDSNGTEVAFMGFDVNPRLRIGDSVTFAEASSGTFTTGAWYRLEMAVPIGNSVTINARLFTGANLDGTSADHAWAQTTADTSVLAGNIASIRFGNSIAGPTISLDDVAFSTSDWLGPYVTATTRTVTHTADAIVQQQGRTVTHTADAILQQQGRTVAHTADAVIQKQGLTVAHTADAVIRATPTVTHTATAVVVSQPTKTHTADAIIQQQGRTVSHTADAIRVLQPTVTHTATAVVQRQGITVTHTATAVILQTRTLTHTADALLVSQPTKAHTADAIVQQQGRTVTHTADAVRVLQPTVTHTATAVVQQQGRTVSHTADALLLATRTLTHTADAVLVRGNSVTHSADAVVQQLGRTVSHTANAHLVRQFTLTHAADAVVQQQGRTVVHTADAVLRATLTVTHTATAVLLATRTVAHTADALIQRVGTVTHAADAVILQTRTVVHTADAIKVIQPTVAHTATAVILQARTVAHTADAHVVRTLTVTHTANAVLQQQGRTVTHTADAVLRATRTVAHTADALLTAGHTVTHSADAVVQQLGRTVGHTADAHVVSQASASHTADARLYGDPLADATGLWHLEDQLTFYSDLRNWSVALGTPTYSNGEWTLGEGDRIESPPFPVPAVAGLLGTAIYEVWTDTASPYFTPDGGYLAGTAYFAADGTTPAYNDDVSPGPYTGNGNAGPLTVGAWQDATFGGFTLGANVHFVRFALANDDTLVGTTLKLRAHRFRLGLPIAGDGSSGIDLNLLGDPDTPWHVQGINDYAVGFVGDTQLQAPNVADFNYTGDVSAVAWVKTSGAGAEYRGVIGMQQGGPYGGNYWLGLLNNVPHVFSWSDGGHSGTATAINDNEWHHLALTVEGTTGRLYVDGVEVWSGLYGHGTAGVALALGGHGVFGQNLTGYIDEAAVWDRALIAAEVAALYTRQQERLWWHTADAVVQQQNRTVAHSADAVLIPGTFTPTVTHAADAVVVAQPTATHTADAVVQRTATVTHTATAHVVSTPVAQHTATAVLQQLGRTLAHTANAVLLATRTASQTADALLLATRTASHLADAVLRRTATVTHTADAVLLGTRTASHTADAYVVAGSQVNHSADAVVRATPTASHTADARVVAYAAFDAATESVRTATTDPYSFNHTPVGVPNGVVVTIASVPTNTDLVTGVTYGGVAMTRVQTNVDNTTEPARTYIYFLGSNIPTGTQAVQVDFTSATTDDQHIVCTTYVSTGDMEMVAVGGVDNNAANPSVNLSNPLGRRCMVHGVIYSGLGTVASLTPNGSMTAVHDHGFAGAFVSRTDRFTAYSTATTLTYGYTSATDDVAMSVLAFAAKPTVVTTDHTADALVVSQPTETHTADAVLLQLGRTTGHTADAVLAAQPTESHTANAVVVSARTVAHSADAALLAARVVSHTADAVVVSGRVVTHSADASLRGARTTAHTADAYLTSAAAIAHTADAVIRATRTVTHTADAVLQGARTVQHTATAVLRGTRTASHTADARLVSTASPEVGHSADAVVQRTATVAHTADALLQRVGTATHSADAILKGARTAQHMADAVLSAAFSRTHSADAVISGSATTSHTATAVIVALGRVVSHTADAFIRGAYRWHPILEHAHAPRDIDEHAHAPQAVEETVDVPGAIEKEATVPTDVQLHGHVRGRIRP